jgi:uncharacterized protein (TIGR03790 family)
LSFEETEASVDSELALVLWPNYSRSKWVINPMHYAAGRGNSLPVVMVSRLDGPSVDIVHRIIDESVEVEKTGLQGKVVLDARGKPREEGIGSYGWYDDSIRTMARILEPKLGPGLIFDDQEPIFPKGTASGVALYNGWYALRNYTPACLLEKGAVAWHVASFELTGWDDPQSWCPQLLRDGAAVTMGAVGEPYLSAFPRSDDFNGLLLTGKLSLAEAYWSTQLMASWKIVLIGDPLYRPYAKTPILSASDLPERLRPLVAGQ